MSNHNKVHSMAAPRSEEILNLRNGCASYYSLRPIRRRDLARLAKIAHRDVEQYFDRNSAMEVLYRKRFLCSALCQGAAIHFALPEIGYGVKDFDVWTFFGQPPRGSPRGMFKRGATAAAFDSPTFGEDPYKVVVGSRKVDLLWRTIDASVGDPVRAVQNWLSGPSASAECLSHKAVVLIDPPKLRGRIIWLLGRPV
jgi:hypothetical protein